MTREEQIKQEAEEQAKELYLDKHNLKWMFKHGVEWADKNPKEGIVDIDKVCAYLYDKLYTRANGAEHYVASKDKITQSEFIEKFRKAMEEQE